MLVGCMPTPFTMVPFSVSASRADLVVGTVEIVDARGDTSPFEFFHGPLPMRSLGLTGPARSARVVLR